MSKYKTYRKQRYFFFLASLLFYFVPYIAATASLLPFVVTNVGTKWSIGLALALLNALPFIGGLFRKLFAHVPFINWLAILFVALAAFFTLDLFREYVHTFLTIESIAAAGSLISSVLWSFHRKYKRKAQTVKDVADSGLVGGGS